MSLRVFIARDAGALSVGADEVAAALAAEGQRRSLDIEIVRTGSHGLYWAEPMIEVATAAGRVAYGPVAPNDVEELLDAGMLDGREGHRLCLGATTEIPWLKRQTRLIFARCGVVDPLSLSDYRDHGGGKGLERALSLGAAATLDEVEASGLRGRGGAGFPTGRKWRTVAETGAQRKFIACNADEGDSGTFADRMIMEGDPFSLIEGMAIAGFAVGAGKGYVYLRSEYPHAADTFERALTPGAPGRHARETALPDRAKLSTSSLRIGAGSYVCGEETAMLESLEGKRGQVRARPPLPAHKGLFGQPTVVNNVISLASAPFILAEGGAAFGDIGFGRSRGTMPIQIAGNVRYGGLFETGFGISLGELVEDIGGGTRSGRPVRAVQVGGPLGAYIPRSLFDTPYDFEAFTAIDGLIGHGGIVVFDDTVDMRRQARFALEFCALGILRQMHAVSHRLEPRRRTGRSPLPACGRSGRKPSQSSRTCAIL